MNNPNPFLPQRSFLEQKNKARMRLKIVVYISISMSVLVLMGLLIQGCKKPTEDVGSPSGSAGVDTNTSMPQLPTNAPDMGVASNTPPPPDTNPPAPLPPTPPPAPPAPPVATSEEYTVVKGDTFATIATHNHVPTKAIVEANPGVDPKKLKIGQKIHLPAAASASTTASAPTALGGGIETPAAGGVQTYKVKSGDTLDGIHKKFKVSVKSIQSANSLTTTSIKVGQVLKIPGAAAPAQAPAPEPAPVQTLPPPSLSAPAPAPGTAMTAPHATH